MVQEGVLFLCFHSELHVFFVHLLILFLSFAHFLQTAFDLLVHDLLYALDLGLLLGDGVLKCFLLLGELEDLFLLLRNLEVQCLDLFHKGNSIFLVLLLNFVELFGCLVVLLLQRLELIFEDSFLVFDLFILTNELHFVFVLSFDKTFFEFLDFGIQFVVLFGQEFDFLRKLALHFDCEIILIVLGLLPFLENSLLESFLLHFEVVFQLAQRKLCSSLLFFDVLLILGLSVFEDFLSVSFMVLQLSFQFIHLVVEGSALLFAFVQKNLNLVDFECLLFSLFVKTCSFGFDESFERFYLIVLNLDLTDKLGDSFLYLFSLSSFVVFQFLNLVGELLNVLILLFYHLHILVDLVL